MLDGDNNTNLTSSTSEEDFYIPAAITDAGCERDLNEDRYAVVESPSGLVWLVCDGMGGVKGGELAAQLAIDAIRRHLESGTGQFPPEALHSAFQEANRIIVLRRQNQAFAQMGTTIVGAVFNGNEVAISHIGDSRAYLVRNNKINQLTIDHTYVQELVDKGNISHEEALSHPQAHVLTKAIGAEPTVDFETKSYWIWDVENPKDQDYLVLCTDGLYSMMTDEEICSHVSSYTPQEACSRMVELSKERGGYDNITIAIVPLTGQLKDEMPPNYVPQLPQPNVVEKKTALDVGGVKKLLVKNIFMVVALTLVALLLVFVVVLIGLS